MSARHRVRKQARRHHHQRQALYLARETRRRIQFSVDSIECDHHRRRRKQGRAFYVEQMQKRGWTEADIESLAGGAF